MNFGFYGDLYAPTKYDGRFIYNSMDAKDAIYSYLNKLNSDNEYDLLMDIFNALPKRYRFYKTIFPMDEFSRFTSSLLPYDFNLSNFDNANFNKTDPYFIANCDYSLKSIPAKEIVNEFSKYHIPNEIIFNCYDYSLSGFFEFLNTIGATEIIDILKSYVSFQKYNTKK